MADQKLMRGTMVLTAATLISKILGFVYIVPFSALVGQVGLALYGYGYAQYVVILSLATLGVPLAVSKFVSKYHSLGDYETGHRLFKSGLLFMSITGFLAFLTLFLLAPVLAPSILPVEKPGGNTQADVIFTIRMVSVALIIVPVMAIIRGYFQGFQSMGPTSVSQVVEQIVRISFILAMAFIIVGVGDGSIGIAVGFATFGAFVGGLGGLAVLLYYWFKRRKHILKQVEESTTRHQLTLPQMYKELIAYALPLSFVGLAIPLFQYVDLFTVNNALSGTSYEAVSESFFGALNQSVHKIVLIPMALATALSITLVPTITKSFTSGDHDALQRQITQTYQIILFISVPAAVGMAALAYPVFASLYGLEDLAIGGMVLQYYGPMTLLFSLFAVTAAILQGMNRQKQAVLSLVAALLVKLALNYLMLLLMGPAGAIVSTYAGYLVGIMINVWAIGRYAQFDYSSIFKRFLLVLMFSGVMAGAVILAINGLQSFMPLDTRLNSFILMFIGVGIGALVYGYLVYRSGLAEKVLGHRFRFLKRKKAAKENS
ncbi:putative polysaccharide biosynthesis protein [Alkalihalophilus marmarensis]|uniref:putative polysaccharide biosynthesis protein n=1 Tax=Alkalihalophilus marmarensis TaxID=521377 RepID=UPI002DB85B30|nr:polysaccharide biosynthesis protein [Alkalihalophilus marmarensis]MEC2071810.1 polysaccharide biosynthesis protein [Alkalihalophilus marmarensis]